MIDPIQRSFELAAERCEHLTPLVYRRLFHDYPETEPMFWRDTSGLIKGSMLAFAIDAILDFAGSRSGAFRMIGCEVQSHDAYGTPRELFSAFFDVIVATLRELADADWTADMENAWRELIGEIDSVVATQEA